MVKILDCCVLKFYDNYVISVVNHGVTISSQLSHRISEIVLEHYKTKPFVYIANRINSYTVDPDVYSKISEIETLVGFVVVSDSKSTIKTALLEKIFFNKSFQIFNNLDDAILWANNTRNMSQNIKSTKKR